MPDLKRILVLPDFSDSTPRSSTPSDWRKHSANQPAVVTSQRDQTMLSWMRREHGPRLVQSLESRITEFP